MKISMRYGSPQLLLLGLILIHAGLLAWGAVVHSPTIDEVEWLPGGWGQWKTGRTDVVIRNPPHVGLWAAIPLLFADADTTALEGQGDARAIGRALIRTNDSQSFWLFTLGRWACIPFSIIGLIACFVWARKLYGPRPGVLAATLWCFSPSVLAHGQLVSHDVAATSLGLVACFAFWRWLCSTNFTTTALAGVSLGLAQLTKMTMLIHFILWPLLWIAWIIGSREKRWSVRSWLTQSAMLAAILVIAIDVLNLGYGFQGSFARLDSYSFQSESLSGASDIRGNRFADSLLGGLPVPLPATYLGGLDRQRYALEGAIGSRATYLRGEWSNEGKPYYYLYALAIKVPLGTWCLLLLSVVFRMRRADAANHARDEAVLLAPAVAILLVASVSSDVASHMRYVLPCLPFAFIWISRLANLSLSAHRWLGSAAIAATAWAVLSSLWVYPHSLSYFNEIVGGPRYGHYHLVSSNIDYGQDLIHLKQWFDAHPEARPLGLAYWDLYSVDPRIAGIEYSVAPSGPPPTGPIDESAARELGPRPGWYAVNVNTLRGDRWPGRVDFADFGYYGYFLEFTPVARAGYSILIYHVSLAEANRVRRKLGLPLLDSGDERQQTESCAGHATEASVVEVKKRFRLALTQCQRQEHGR